MHQLYSKPTAPVIRTRLQWSDHPGATRYVEAFTNIADPQQREVYQHLSKQSAVRVRGYDAGLALAVQRQVTNRHQREIAQIVAVADKLLWTIPTDEYDFATAVARVRETTML